MVIYKQIFPTKFPLFEFYLRVWRLEIGTDCMRESMESTTYEYVRLRIDWKGKNLFHCRLFDTYRRQVDRLDGIYNEPQPITIKRLKEIKKVVNEEIKKLKEY